MSQLSYEEVRSLLNLKNRWIVLTTLDSQGYPHSVPMGYFLMDDKIILGCRDDTQKVVNLERNSRCSLLWENGREAEDMIGILFRGHGRVVRDDEERLLFKSEACRQRGEEPPKEASPGAVYIEVTPARISSWRKPRRGR